MIQLFHVSKYYDRRPALSDVTLEIEKGEFVLLMGPSGAGKSTLLKLLIGAERPEEGQVLIQGRSLSKLRASEIPVLRRKVGVVLQDFRLLPKKTVFENVALPLLVQGASITEIRRKVAEALRSVGLDHKKDLFPLADRVRALGGQIQLRTIPSLDAALAECPRVINCAGLGARTLVDDPLLYPVRGQIVRVENPGPLTRVWIDEHSGRGITYIVPRSRDVVLGGSSHAHEEDRSPDPALTREIVARCAALEPSLAAARILSVAVGLRPARSPLRLSAAPHTDSPTPGLVIHNYGHGGAGVTLSWGCAEAVLDLLHTHEPA